jgi:hypothetical protein
MRSGFWKADWFVGLAVVILFALSNGVFALQPAARTPSANIAIDRQSIDDLGRRQGWYASLTVRSPRTRWT